MLKIISSRICRYVCGWTLAVALVPTTSQAVAATLEWDRSPDPDVAFYTVHWGTAAGSYDFAVDVGEATAWEFVPPSPYITYHFAVQAHTADGLGSPLSQEVRLAAVPVPPMGALTDLTRDGYPDLIWQNQENLGLVAWMTTGTLMIGSEWLTPHQSNDPAWKLVGVADMNQDSYADIIWHNPDIGSLVVWQMRGLRLVDVFWITPTGATTKDWKVVGVGDLNADGHPDLVWQDDVSRQLVVWFMNRLKMVASEWMSPRGVPDLDWRVVAVADFNRDGKSDLLWKHATEGGLVVSMMNGSRIISSDWLSPTNITDMDWRVAAVRDFNNDGWPDILWQHEKTGKLNLWAMLRLHLMSATWFSPSGVSDLAWKVVGGH